MPVPSVPPEITRWLAPFPAPVDAASPERLGTVLRSAFHSDPEPLLLVDPFHGSVLRVNTAACDLFRRTEGELVGMTLDRFYPDARGTVHVFTEETLTRGHAYSRDLTLKRANAEPMDLEHKAVAVRLEGRSCLLIRIVDLSQLRRRDLQTEAEAWHRLGLDEWRRAENHFRELKREHELILAAAGEGVYGVNADGITTFVNPAGAEMLGYEAWELVGQEMHPIIHHHRPDGSHYPVAECPIYNAFRHGTVNTVTDEIFWAKGDRPVPVEYTSTPIRDAGALVGAVIVFRDVSERKRNEERLRQALDENARLRRRLEAENVYLQEEIRSHSRHEEILGSSEAIAKIVRQIDLVAPTGANVLITGESGTGKELVARAIHQASPRRGRPLIRVNCAAVPRELFESEFFGHVKGSFTGAVRDRVGRFDLADGGTLFLDEVGEIPLDLQSKLLRVLQDRKFERVGDEKTRSVDVRLIAATNRDLRAEVAAGRFREDLYFRLNVFPIECTPLRERPKDIPILAERFLRMACTAMNLPKPELTLAAVERLGAYHWPGNARELQNVMERAAILSRDGRLLLLEGLVDRTVDRPVITERPSGPETPEILTEEQMHRMMKSNIRNALRQTGGRVSGPHGAAALLGIKPTTLNSRMKTFAITVEARSDQDN